MSHLPGDEVPDILEMRWRCHRGATAHKDKALKLVCHVHPQSLEEGIAYEILKQLNKNVFQKNTAAS